MPLNFSQLLGGAAFSSLNAILGHNASRDGYSRPNRFEVIITLPAGVSGTSSQGAGDSALASNLAALGGLVRLQEEYLFVVTQYQCQTEV